MTGSHIDTVRTGGLYDGNLGVLAGLEVIETLIDARRRDRARWPSRSSPTRRAAASPPTCSAASSTSAVWRWRRRSTSSPSTAPGSATSSSASATPGRCRARPRPRPRSSSSTSSRVRCSRTTASRSARSPGCRASPGTSSRSPASRTTPAPRRCAIATTPVVRRRPHRRARPRASRSTIGEPPGRHRRQARRCTRTSSTWCRPGPCSPSTCATPTPAALRLAEVDSGRLLRRARRREGVTVDVRAPRPLRPGRRSTPASSSWVERHRRRPRPHRAPAAVAAPATTPRCSPGSARRG